MKHYFHPMSRGASTDWMLKELDVDHEQVIVDFTSGENDTPEFRAINPMGKVPTLEDEGIIVTETAAICAYLADKYPAKGFAPSPTSPERGRYYRFLFFSGTTLEPMFTFEQLGIDNDRPQSTGWGDFDRCMVTVESLTPARDWAMGAQFTAADVVFGGTLDFALQFGWLKTPTPKVMSYVKRLKSRAAYKLTHDPAWH